MVVCSGVGVMWWSVVALESIFFLLFISVCLDMSKTKFEMRHLQNNKEYSSTEIQHMFYKIFSYLGNVSRDFDYCFVGGAFVFEDPYGHLFNLLTYNRLNLTSDECASIGKVKQARGVKMIQTMTHGVFAKNGAPAPCTRSEPNAKIPGCILNPFKCNKYERAMKFTKMCNRCGIYPENEPMEPKEVILYYPFTKTVDGKDNRYLYVKFEAHSVFGLGHLADAKDTYITGNKMKRDNKRFLSRRENAKYTSAIELKDDLFYVNRADEGVSNIDSYHTYNSGVRAGREFFITADLLNMFLDIYLNESPETSICTILNPLKIKPLTRSLSRSRSKSLNSGKSKKKTMKLRTAVTGKKMFGIL